MTNEIICKQHFPTCIPFRPHSSAGPIGQSHKVAKNILKFFSSSPLKSSLGTDYNSSNDGNNKPTSAKKHLQRKPRDAAAHRRYFEERKALRREDSSDSSKHGGPNPKRFRHPKKDSKFESSF